MRSVTHTLGSNNSGSAREIVSHHFGTEGGRPSVYIQAGLHAGEIPGMLLCRHLLPLLEAFEASGRVTGEITVIPACNPIGLNQGLFNGDIGRFEFYSTENFNRHYPDLETLVAERLDGKLGADAERNKAAIRAEMHFALAEDTAKTELDEQRRVLLGMACQADMVLDLHCDLEAQMHLYTTNNSAEWGGVLASYLGAVVTLLSDESGGNAFDESCSTPWKRLAERFGDKFPIPVGCRAATVELRGLVDVSDATAAIDAQHIADWLIAVGMVTGTAPAPEFGPSDIVPLAGTDDIVAPFGGILSFHHEIGARLKPGDPVVDLIDPITGRRETLRTKADGIFYAREDRRYVRRGASIAQVSGAIPLRTGSLLAAR